MLIIIKNQTSLKLNNLKNNKMYLILQLQCLFNTPVNFTFTGKFHTDNTQHKYPLSTNFHIFRVKLNRHTYRTPHLVYRPIYRHSPTTKFNRHTHRAVSNSTDIYIWHTNWFMHLYTNFSHQHASQVTKLSRHIYQTKHNDWCWT